MRCYHICIIKINPISPCSHTDAQPNLNREVRHSPTWHSSESESALERFEPVAVAKLQRDGRGTLFALVAARRQKVFKRGKHSSFCPFRSFRTSEKNTKRKVSLCFFAGRRRRRPLQDKVRVQPTAKTKDLCLSAFSFAYTGAKEKAIKKKTPEGNFALCGARQGRLALDPAASPKGGRKL